VGIIYERSELVQPWSERKGLSFVGSFRHPPNQDGVTWFLENVWPHVDERIKLDGIEIIGSNAPDDLLKFSSTVVTFTGQVPSTEPFLQSARLSVAPLRFGAGSKGKVCDAWSHGLPVVGTSVALQGMLDEKNDAYLAADSPKSFAKLLNDLYFDEGKWNTVSRAAQTLISQLYGSDVAQRQMENALKAVIGIV
jgi:glycosyltransferase involved in cell wall biosynthesis